MISNLIDFALNNRWIVLCGGIVLFAWGIIAFHELPVEAYPDVANNYVQIITQWPGRSAEDVERCGAQIIRNASDPLIVDGQDIQLTLSIGVSIFPENGRTVDELLRHADTAMYAVKDAGRNSLCVFNDNLTARYRPTA